ncbi:MAG: hypothetical protein V4543_02920 [Bacteroidota bacterium]
MTLLNGQESIPSWAKKAVLLLVIVISAAVTWYDKMNVYIDKYDDAYIGYRIAKNIISGYGEVYNRGEVVRANTSLLYPALISPAFLLETDTAIRVLDYFDLLTFLAATLVFAALTTGLAEQLTGFKHWLILPLVYLMLAGYQNLSLGMETQVYILTIGLTFYLYYIKKRMFAAFALSCTGIFIRPEGVLLTIIVFACALADDRKNILKYLYTGSGAALLYLLISVGYYGEFIPHTASVKDVLFPDKFESAKNYFITVFIPQNLYTFYSVFAIIPIILLGRRLNGFLIWGFAYFIFFSLKATWFNAYGWYRMPFSYFITSIEAIGIIWAFVWARKNMPLVKQGGKIRLAFDGFAALISVAYTYKLFCLTIIINSFWAKDYQNRVPVARCIAEKLNEIKPTGYCILEPVGIIGLYAFDVKFKDYPGLNNHEVFDVVKEYREKGHFFAYGDSTQEFEAIVAKVPGLQYAILRRHEANLLLKKGIIAQSQIVKTCFYDINELGDKHMLIVKLKD